MGDAFTKEVIDESEFYTRLLSRGGVDAIAGTSVGAPTNVGPIDFSGFLKN